MLISKHANAGVILPVCTVTCLFLGGCKATENHAPAVIETQAPAATEVQAPATNEAKTVAAADIKAVEVVVASADEVEKAMMSANPGDTLVMRDGDWVDQLIVFCGQGTEEHPITLRAETPGAVVLKGESGLSISGNWLVVEGLLFEGVVAQPKERIVAFTGDQGHASDCRITNTAMINCNPEDPKTKYTWVELYGQRNRVDHCRFEGRNHRGVTLTISINDEPADHRIDRNHFIGRTPPTANYREFESIRIGQNSSADTRAGVTVAHNLFENEAGDADTILSKSGGNTIRHNGFIACARGISLRQGNGSRVEGNVFLGRGIPDAGGLLIAGTKHQIIGNYLQEIAGTGRGALTLAAGSIEPTSKTYPHAADTTVAYNTVVNPLGPALMMDWGHDNENAGLRPSGISVINNLFLGSASGDLFAGTEGDGWSWTNNICFGATLGIAPREGLAVVDPQMAESSDGLWRPAPSSPAIDAAGPAEGTSLGNDIDGHPRDQGAQDIGADETETNRSNPRGAPLTDARVGPKWLR